MTLFTLSKDFINLFLNRKVRKEFAKLCVHSACLTNLAVKKQIEVPHKLDMKFHVQTPKSQYVLIFTTLF